MDSLDFMRTCYWSATRDEADLHLEAAMRWIGIHARPENLFTPMQLAEWANKNGYTTARDVSEICALLKSVRSLIPRDMIASTQIDEAIYQYGGWTQ